MKFLRIILIFVSLLCVVPAVDAAGPKWELVQSVSAGAPVYEGDKIEVSVSDGYIYLFTPKTVTVKVMSIVGQLISEQQLPAGMSKLRISARGIYILKAGDVTLRVTI